jgi:hypothetical protein
MQTLLITSIVILSALSFGALLSYQGETLVFAQNASMPEFANNTETISELENILGDDQHIIINGTNIANPDNTLPDSISVNIDEHCIQLPNSKNMYCP